MTGRELVLDAESPDISVPKSCCSCYHESPPVSNTRGLSRTGRTIEATFTKLIDGTARPPALLDRMLQDL
jgi:hypothetical protein